MPQSHVDAPRPRFDTFLLCCGFIGSIVFGLVNFGFSVVNTDYIIGRQAIGDLELLPHGWIQSVDFIIFGLFTWAFAVGLRRELTGGFGSVLIPLSQELTALGLIIAGVFIRDPMHVISSIVTFIAMTAGFFLFALRFRGDTRWRGWTSYTVISGVLMIILLCLFAWAKANHGYVGLFERLSMIDRGLWLFFFAIRASVGVRVKQPGAAQRL